MQCFLEFLQGAPGSAVLHRPQLGFGVFGALQGGGEVVFGVGDGVAEVVAFAELEVVQVARRDVEGGFEGQVLFGEVVGVDAVEQDGLVAGAGDEGFPGLVAFPRGFDEDDPRPPLSEVHAAQDGFFVAFDVDFQEVDRAISGVLFADGGQGAGCDGLAAHVQPGVFVLLGQGRVEGREAGAGDAVEGQVIGAFTGHALQVDVVGALLAEGIVVIWHGFDVDAGPAVVVEGFGDGVVGGVVGPDVDIEAVFDIFEGAPQADVFEILCVRNERHGRILSVRFFLFMAALSAPSYACIARGIARRNFPPVVSGVRRLCRFD